LKISAGVGVTVGESFGEVLGRADRALYQAKNAGRDRVAVDTLGPAGQPL